MSEIITTAVIEKFNEAFRLHDITLLYDIISEGCIMEAAMPAPNGIAVSGKEECLVFWEGLMSNKETRFTPEKVTISGENAFIQWRCYWGEGEENSVRGVNIMKIENGKIIEALGYVKASMQI